MKTDKTTFNSSWQIAVTIDWKFRAILQGQKVVSSPKNDKFLFTSAHAPGLQLRE